jgi:carbamoyl-phosphate synthase small subunit
LRLYKSIFILTFAKNTQMAIERIPAILLLADGTVFRGTAAGKIGTTIGEICFNTGMTGYQEIFTDPSYFGQLVVMTNTHIGNYGVRLQENESNSPKIAGMICKSYNIRPSRTMATDSLNNFLQEHQTVGITDIDTRGLVLHIRRAGAMNALISSEDTDIDLLREKLANAQDMAGMELSSKVSTLAPYIIGNEDAPYRVAVMDYGVKRSILTNIVQRNCCVKVFPAQTNFETVEAWKPDGVFLSNGPCDPDAMHYAVEFTQKVLAKEIPSFGICLGHQILALALGVPTYKMHHGHRGCNHPVKNLITGRCEITSQNHGFGVSKEAILDQAQRIKITHINLNDATIEGLEVKDLPAFSVQYHPESSPGPHDSRYLFDEFVKMLN